MKIVLAVPTYGPVDPKAARHLRMAMIYAVKHGIEIVGDASPDRTPHAGARNQAVESALGTDADAIFWCDSDIILPQETIVRMASYGLDFVSGVYFQREAPHTPLFGTYNGKGFSWCLEFPENQIGPCDGIGFGCVLTSTKMLREMLGSRWSKEWKNELFKYDEFSEDLTFCLRAAKLGYRPHVDTGILLGHLADPKVITIEDFKPHAARLKTAGQIVKVG